jgi:hypothetical protein
MSRSRHRHTLPARPRRLWVLVPVIALAAAALLGGYLQHRGGDAVVIRTVSEMPKLDVGVELAVHATFVGDRTPAVGQPADLRLVVTSGATGAQISARVLTPDGAALEKGMAHWEGQLDYEQQAEIPVSVVLPGDHGGFVRAEITTVLPDGQQFVNATSVYVDPGQPDSPLPVDRTLIEPDGSRLNVSVYKAK